MVKDRKEIGNAFDKSHYHKLFIRTPKKKGSFNSSKNITRVREVSRQICRLTLAKNSLHAREGSKVLRLIIQTISNLQELQFLKKQNLIKPKISEKK